MNPRRASISESLAVALVLWATWRLVNELLAIPGFLATIPHTSFEPSAPIWARTYLAVAYLALRTASIAFLVWAATHSTRVAGWITSDHAPPSGWGADRVRGVGMRLIAIAVIVPGVVDGIEQIVKPSYETAIEGVVRLALGGALVVLARKQERNAMETTEPARASTTLRDLMRLGAALMGVDLLLRAILGPVYGVTLLPIAGKGDELGGFASWSFFAQLVASAVEGALGVGLLLRGRDLAERLVWQDQTFEIGADAASLRAVLTLAIQLFGVWSIVSSISSLAPGFAQAFVHGNVRELFSDSFRYPLARPVATIVLGFACVTNARAIATRLHRDDHAVGVV